MCIFSPAFDWVEINFDQLYDFHNNGEKYKRLCINKLINPKLSNCPMAIQQLVRVLYAPGSIDIQRDNFNNSTYRLVLANNITKSIPTSTNLQPSFISACTASGCIPKFTYGMLCRQQLAFTISMAF